MNEKKLMEKEILLNILINESIFTFVRAISFVDDDRLHEVHRAILEEFKIREFGDE